MKVFGAIVVHVPRLVKKSVVDVHILELLKAQPRPQVLDSLLGLIFCFLIQELRGEVVSRSRRGENRGERRMSLAIRENKSERVRKLLLDCLEGLLRVVPKAVLQHEGRKFDDFIEADKIMPVHDVVHRLNFISLFYFYFYYYYFLNFFEIISFPQIRRGREKGPERS